MFFQAFKLLSELGVLKEVLPEYEEIPERLIKSFENERELRSEILFWTILFLPIFLSQILLIKIKKILISYLIN